MEASVIHERIRTAHGNSVGGEISDAAWPVVEIKPEAIAEVCRTLRDEEELSFESLSNLTAVDNKNDDAIEVYYHLYSYAHRHQVVLKVSISRDDPQLATVCGVWEAANWLEREAFDLMGVRFVGHPDLRRILMPEDWVGHPLRKDFVEPEEYHGISTRRESLLKL